jgi:hypothetical protein
MVSVGTTTATTYSVAWFEYERRMLGGGKCKNRWSKRKKIRCSKKNSYSGTVAGSISNNDLRMDSIIAPVYGRLNTSTALTTATTVSARIKNLDDNNVTSFKMRYYVGGSLVVEELVSSIVTPGSTYIHNFSLPYNFSIAGNYILKVEVENLTGTDPISSNNSITDTIRQLNNDPIPFLSLIILNRQFHDNTIKASLV